ncbi:cysteinyl-tRNA synthetase [Spiroplasma helicoides]|uniref:Cysteine--tRNA ligase n=1 Tax=Spiroplasma helicoides TaxID=216938 RepID=A0A1B3SJ77_9MOLU|nr:cysteine--tRNA ligase [Spiroplasma helicoides]AOG59985.1 cysteinyl-tRNA synthetase [Spiroplasma helicoides]
MIKLYDTLSGSLKELKNKEINIYTCGPTVYNFIHIGNARPMILTDTLVRFLEFQNYKVNYLLNITDVDDKIIQRAIEENSDELEISKKYTNFFLKDLEALNIKMPSKITPISTKLNEMIIFIEDLIAKGYAYEVDGNVYFDIESNKSEYGVLSKQKIKELNIGNRVEKEENKKNAADFVLWKKTNLGIRWESPWGLGRPGWHTECALLIDDYFDRGLDIHVGGIDLKFPHHENERIQYVSKNYTELASIWMYNGHLSVEDVKMSKSLNNFILVKDFLSENHSNILRYIYLVSNYKQPQNLSSLVMKQAADWNNKVISLIKQVEWMTIINELKIESEPIKTNIEQFIKYMSDDLNTPMVLTLVDKMIKDLNKEIKEKVLTTSFEDLKTILKVLGFNFQTPKISENDKELLINWRKSINEKNYEKADNIRAQLYEKGII